jgi:hypothetical protein
MVLILLLQCRATCRVTTVRVSRVDPVCTRNY